MLNKEKTSEILSYDNSIRTCSKPLNDCWIHQKSKIVAEIIYFSFVNINKKGNLLHLTGMTPCVARRH